MSCVDAGIERGNLESTTADIYRALDQDERVSWVGKSNNAFSNIEHGG